MKLIPNLCCSTFINPISFMVEVNSPVNSSQGVGTVAYIAIQHFSRYFDHPRWALTAAIKGSCCSRLKNCPNSTRK